MASAPARIAHGSVGAGPAEELTAACRSRAPIGWSESVAAGAGRSVLVTGRVGAGAPETAILQLCTVVRAFARLDLPPAEALSQLDALFAEWHPAFGAHLLYAVVDPVADTVTYATAGHPPPLRRTPDGPITVLPSPVGAPLGQLAGPYAEASASLPPGGCVVAVMPAAAWMPGTAWVPEGGWRFDDGWAAGSDDSEAAVPPEIEAALDGGALGGRVLDGGVRDRAGGGTADAEEAADRLDRALGERAAALLVAFRAVPRFDAGRSRVIELDLAEGEEPTRRARAFCYGVLSTWRLPALIRDDIVLAVSELVANALLYGGAAEQLRLRRTATRVIVEVFDRELTMPRPRIADADAESGRGLYLVRRVATRWGARRVPGGKAVWCEFEIPVQPLADGSAFG